MVTSWRTPLLALGQHWLLRCGEPAISGLPKTADGTVRPINELSLRLDWRCAMDNVTFFAPANRQWVWSELEMMGVLRRMWN